MRLGSYMKKIRPFSAENWPHMRISNPLCHALVFILYDVYVLMSRKRRFPTGELEGKKYKDLVQYWARMTIVFDSEPF